MPGELLGNSALPVGDYFWNSSTGWKAATLGGFWTSGTSAGAFYWYLDYSPDTHRRAIGGRLVYVPSKKVE